MNSLWMTNLIIFFDLKFGNCAIAKRFIKVWFHYLPSLTADEDDIVINGLRSLSSISICIKVFTTKN